MSSNDDVIILGHGSGGALTNRLIKDVFQEAFENPILDELLDAAVLDIDGGKLAFTTDSFVVDPFSSPVGISVKSLSAELLMTWQ